MELPLEITFRGLDRSDAIEASIRRRAAQLDRFFGRIMGCRVVVESPHQHHRKGRIYHVRVDLTVPGEELVVRRDPSQHAAHEDVYLAIHDAFREARRQVQDYARRQRGQVKGRVGPPHGRVVELFKEEGYGFLETKDGWDLYFHRNSVLNDAFDRLEIGTEVRFAEEAGEKGPQASTVEIVGREGRHEF
ncbi:MAG TPA: HPF/RaiA family ribosome-associated protein [Vicinamibacteria bacterium]|nr:HPF/RaiA family ribosome-associated protein [Vicinamibacteria bacterium]